MKTRKILAIILAVLMILTVFTGCGKKENPGNNSSVNTGSDTNAGKDTVIVAISTNIDTLDPTQGWGHGNTPLVQSTLIRYNYDMSFAYDLAIDYALDDTGLVWTFKLREDAFFTDGEQVKADDVVFTLKKVKDAGTSADLTVLSKIEATDDFTVVCTLSEPSSIFLNTIASIGIVPSHAYSDDYGINPIGSGPWKFVQLNPQEQLILEANENYYGTVPSIKNAVIVFMDEDAALAAAQSGQVDVALTSATLATQSIDGYTLTEITSVDNRGFTLPMLPDEGKFTASGYPIGNNVTCNLEIRQAIAYCIDRDAIADVALNGFATPCYSENDGMPWNNPEVKIETNVEYSKQLLADNGWVDTDGDGIVEKDGVKAEFTVLYPSGDSARQALGMAAAEQIKAIGINVIIEGTSWDDLAKRMFSCGVVMGWGAANPAESFYLYRSEGALLDDFYNPEGYMNETTDGYFKAAMNALTVEDAYANWRLAQWDGTTGTSMKGNCPWVWMVNISHVYFVRDGLDIGNQQLHPHGASMPVLQNLNEWTWAE